MGMNNELKKVIELIDERKKQLSGMNKEQIEKELNDEKNRLQETIENLKENEKETQKIREEIAEYEKQIEIMKSSVAAAISERERRKEENKTLNLNFETLKRELDALLSEENKQSLERCRNQIQIMSQIRRSMEQSFSNAEGAMAFSVDSYVNDRVKNAQMCISELQKLMAKYAGLWQSKLN